ncbi:GntR family transcriptional regulator [Marinomonas sp. C2222]|uniref:GntR family transcriptional regulator n=1 Tax=Marinomonas sargassi TaxID=2984494 RepID=A0ABT2YSN0_9GAMM|nr:GntR family transcriptional regulator [Marinomonas sargassi]MCV2402897.1 GntR family transcriptional regulator [Marinomonas sargassi]
MNVKQQIKEDILNCVLPRGKALRQVELSTRYGVSRIPIRDALLSLKSEGWLSPHGKVGVMIPDLNWREAEDIYLMRSTLEPLLLDKAFSAISSKELEEARQYQSELDGENLSLIRRGELNWAFHQAIYQAANRGTLQRVVESLNKQAIRYLGFQYGPLNYRTTSQSEHSELLLMIENKDKDKALEHLKRHIEKAGALLVNYLKEVQ